MRSSAIGLIRSDISNRGGPGGFEDLFAVMPTIVVDSLHIARSFAFTSDKTRGCDDHFMYLRRPGKRGVSATHSSVIAGHAILLTIGPKRVHGAEPRFDCHYEFRLP